MENLTKSAFIAAAADLTTEDESYINAVWSWATDYALPLDNAEYILDAAADKYAGHYVTDGAFAESFYEDAYAERLAVIRELAGQSPAIEISFDWQETADLVMQNTEGFDFAEFSGHYFWAAD